MLLTDICFMVGFNTNEQMWIFSKDLNNHSNAKMVCKDGTDGNECTCLISIVQKLQTSNDMGNSSGNDW